MNPAGAMGALSAKGWRGSAVLVALGALGGLGHPPVSWPLATIAAFAAGCFALVNCRKQIDAVKVGWLFGVGYFAVSLIWIVEPFMVFPERDGWMAPFAIFFAAAGFGAFWGAGFWTAWKLGIGPGSRALALAGCIAAIGMLREELLTGFPWALPSYVWSDAPVAQALAVVGPHGLTFLTALAAFSPFLARKPWVGATIAAAGISVIWAAGSWRLASGDVEHADQARVRLVQPNVPQAEKWNAAMSEEFFQRLLSLSSRPSDDPVDLVIWPETAVTDLLKDARKRFPEMAASASGAYIVTGVRRHDGGRFYNSMIALSPDGDLIGVYDKRHLVPFGEYVPFGDLLSDLGFNGLAADEGGGFSPGTGPASLNLGSALGNMLALICYEAIFPREIRTEFRPRGMLQITNDGWFGTFAGPQQHFAQARMRSIELGLPLLRSANTGISAVVDGRGRVIARLPLGMQGAVDSFMPAPDPPTLYSKIGDLPIAVVLLSILAMLGWLRIPR